MERSKSIPIPILSFALLIFLIPLMVRSDYMIYMFTLVGFYIVLVSSLDLIYGYTGLVSLGHAASFGIGAYSFGILQVKLGYPFISALIISIIFTTIFSALIGWPMLRIKGPYFALGSMAMGIMVTIVIHNWDSVTGGVSLSGIPVPPKFDLFGYDVDLSKKRTFYYMVYLLVFLNLLLIQRLNHSRVGRAFQSIRENSDLAESLGVNIINYKLLSYTIASAVAAVAGCLYACYMGSIEPEIAGAHMSFQLLVMIVVGGARTRTGEIVGPFLLWFLPELLEAAQMYRPLFFGLVLIFVIILMPNGIAGTLRTLHPRIARWIP